MTFWKLAVIVVIVAIIGVGAYDTVQVLNAHRDVRDTSSATAGAAARAITSTKDRAKARVIADQTAKAHGDVVIAFSYDPVAAIVPGRYIVVYRNGFIPGDAELRAQAADAKSNQPMRPASGPSHHRANQHDGFLAFDHKIEKIRGFLKSIGPVRDDDPINIVLRKQRIDPLCKL